MRWFTALLIYRLLLPLLFLAAFPGWIVKMVKRGGFKTRLGERLSFYSGPPEFDPHGAIHLHAVSVGESLLALKLVRRWLEREPERRFVLATGTATGHAVATSAGIAALRVTYSPLDFRWMVRRYIKRFEPSRIVLIEGEAWPHLLMACRRNGIPVTLVNARMSPRSARRYRKFAPLVRPLFSMLEGVAVQEAEDENVWLDLGVPAEKIHCTGSLKFDPSGGALPSPRPEFRDMIDAFGQAKVVLAASTHDGEDAWIASAIRRASPVALPLIAPRHAERCGEAKRDLEKAGFDVLRKSEFPPGHIPSNKDQVFLIDTTGELRDWTAHADVVVIGKSFLSTGGQNPTEAVLAGKPVVFGPHMENFQPLADQLVHAGGALQVADEEALVHAIQAALDPAKAAEMTRAAGLVIHRHHGATERILDLLRARKRP